MLTEEKGKEDERDEDEEEVFRVWWGADDAKWKTRRRVKVLIETNMPLVFATNGLVATSVTLNHLTRSEQVN